MCCVMRIKSNMTGSKYYIICGLYVVHIICTSSGDEFCVDEHFNAKCEPNEIIIITNATYGRMAVGRCIVQAIQMGCAVNVKKDLDGLCSGKQACNFHVLVELSSTKPCVSGLTPYLDASYRCVKVADLTDKACTSDAHQLSFEPTFHLSSESKDTNCGNFVPNWQIEAKPGQTIQVQLLDFSGPSRSPASCSPLGHITEGVVRTNKTICGNHGDQENVIYTSVSHKLGVTMLPDHIRTNSGLFGLQYKVQGCAETSIPPNVYYRRDGTKAELGCTNDEIRWSMECKDGTWRGEIGNCSDHGYTNKRSSNSFLKRLNDMPESIVIAIVVGIAVLLSIFVLVCGCFYIVKHRGTPDNVSETYAHGPRRTDSEFKMYGPQGRPEDSVNHTPLMYQTTVDTRVVYGTDHTMDKRDMYPAGQPDVEVCSCASYSSIPRIFDKLPTNDKEEMYIGPVNDAAIRQ